MSQGYKLIISQEYGLLAKETFFRTTDSSLSVVSSSIIRDVVRSLTAEPGAHGGRKWPGSKVG
jgi:hypothetical protein